jgi:AcrR family transcriptional regulator
MRLKSRERARQPQHLHPTAKKTLAASRQLVISGGYEALTLTAVAAASGMHKA